MIANQNDHKDVYLLIYRFERAFMNNRMLNRLSQSPAFQRKCLGSFLIVSSFVANRGGLLPG